MIIKFQKTTAISILEIKDIKHPNVNIIRRIKSIKKDRNRKVSPSNMAAMNKDGKILF